MYDCYIITLILSEQKFLVEILSSSLSHISPSPGSNIFLTAVKYIDYEAIVLSDHAPLKLQLNFTCRHSSITWRLDLYGFHWLHIHAN